jgi:hypothetical protein
MKLKILAAIVASIFVAGTARSEECVSFTTPPSFPNYRQEPTPNGFIYVIYPRMGGPLPVVRWKLPDGSRVTGAVPGPVELSFIFLDKTHTVRAIRGLTLNYVTETASGDRTVEYKNANDAVVATDRISGFPFLSPNHYTYIPIDFPPKIVAATFSIPGTLVMRYCVEPGDRIEANAKTLIAKLRRNRRP